MDGFLTNFLERWAWHFGGDPDHGPGIFLKNSILIIVQDGQKVGEKKFPEFSRLFTATNLLFHRLSQQKVNVKRPSSRVIPCQLTQTIT